MSKALGAVLDYLAKEPQILPFIAKGLINMRALAKIVASNSDFSVDAIAMAISRNLESLQAQRVDRFETLLQGISYKVEVHQTVLGISRDLNLVEFYKILAAIKDNGGDVSVIEGSESITLIVDNAHSPLLLKFLHRLGLRSEVLNLVEDITKITITFGEDIEYTPGVLAYLCQLVYLRQVSILEQMSCWREVIFYLENKDVKTIIDLLDNLISGCS